VPPVETAPAAVEPPAELELSEPPEEPPVADAAGVAARALGAVFGASAVANPTLVGIALHGVDTLDLDLAGLLDVAVAVHFGPDDPGHAGLVDLYHQRLFGRAPDETVRAFFVGLLDQGLLTPGALGVLVAESALLETNIDFVGLSAHGLHYLPYPIG